MFNSLFDWNNKKYKGSIMKIKLAAMKTKDNQVFTGKRHAYIMWSMPPGYFKNNNEQGFITENGTFVNREEAAKIAYKSGQIKKEMRELYSEDIIELTEEDIKEARSLYGEKSKLTEQKGVFILSETDLIQYYLVNKNLKMSAGKIAAQCTHGATLIAIRDYEEDSFYKWMTTHKRAIILSASESEMDKLHKQLPSSIKIIDAGYTQIDPGSFTVLVLPIMQRDEASKYIGGFKLLKK